MVYLNHLKVNQPHFDFKRNYQSLFQTFHSEETLNAFKIDHNAFDKNGPHGMIFLAATEDYLKYLPKFQESLSYEENQRYLHAKAALRDQYIIHRGLLRFFLSKLIDARPSTMLLSTNSFGKPLLTGPPNQKWRFNLSHSKDYAIYSFIKDFEIGIDIEYHRMSLNTDQLASKIFSEQEMKEYTNLPEHERKILFFRSWSRKEAISKALGIGLGIEFSKLQLTELSPKVYKCHLGKSKFLVFDLFDSNSYSATVAIQQE